MERALPEFIEISSFTVPKSGSQLEQLNYRCTIQGCKGPTQAKVKAAKVKQI